MSLCTKILHFEWAEKFIVIAFSLEAVLFVLMGFQKMGVNDLISGVSSGSSLDSETMQKMLESINLLEDSTKLQSKLINALISDVGINEISEKVKSANEVSNLDLSLLESEIISSKANFALLNQNLESLNRVYSAQIEALKIK